MTDPFEAEWAALSDEQREQVQRTAAHFGVLTRHAYYRAKELNLLETPKTATEVRRQAATPPDDFRTDVLRALEAAYGSLRAYQLGNSSPDLAQASADHLLSVACKHMTNEERDSSVLLGPAVKARVTGIPRKTGLVVMEYTLPEGGP